MYDKLDYSNPVVIALSTIIIVDYFQNFVNINQFHTSYHLLNYLIYTYLLAYLHYINLHVEKKKKHDSRKFPCHE